MSKHTITHTYITTNTLLTQIYILTHMQTYIYTYRLGADDKETKAAQENRDLLKSALYNNEDSEEEEEEKEEEEEENRDLRAD